METTVVLALGAALFLGIGFVVQQRMAALEPPDERLSFLLLLKLAQRPIWLSGVAIMAVGQVLGAIALKTGNLALVEPVIATNLLVALVVSAVWSRRHLGVREWVGGLLLIAGLAAFVAAGDPHGGNSAHVPWVHWLLAGAVIAVLASACVAISRRRSPYHQATLLAIAAGFLYGMQDALTQRTMSTLDHGVLTMLTDWPAYVLLAVAIIAMLLSQSAFEEAPLSASLPASTALEPLTGIAFGVGLYHEHLDRSTVALSFEILGLAVALVGVYLVAASPIVSSHLSGLRHRDHHRHIGTRHRFAPARDDERSGSS